MTGRGRALFLLPSDRMGGAERVTRTLVREAALSGLFSQVDCFVLCWSRTGTLDALETDHGVRLHYTLAASERGGFLPLLKFLRRGPYDFVFSSHTHLNALSSFARKIGMLQTRRLVARESTMIFERKFNGLGAFFRSMYRLYGRQDLIVCQTDRMRLSLDKNTNGRLRHLLVTLPNPLDRERASEARQFPVPPAVAAIAEDRTRIAWCGRLSDVKNPILAIEVLYELHHRGRTDMHLVMIGDGPLHDEIIRRAQDAGVESHLTMTGFVDNPLITLGVCDMGLVTSEIEGFPNVILEMLAAGIAGIATTDCAGGLDEIPSLSISPNSQSASLADCLENRSQLEADPETSRYLEKFDSREFFFSLLDNSHEKRQSDA